MSHLLSARFSNKDRNTNMVMNGLMNSIYSYYVYYLCGRFLDNTSCAMSLNLMKDLEGSYFVTASMFPDRSHLLTMPVILWIQQPFHGQQVFQRALRLCLSDILYILSSLKHLQILQLLLQTLQQLIQAALLYKKSIISWAKTSLHCL